MSISSLNMNNLAESGLYLSTPESSFVSLEDRMIRNFAETAIATQAEQQDVISRLHQARAFSDPGELLKIQQRTSDYNLQVSTIATLARKGVSTVETLLRS